MFISLLSRWFIVSRHKELSKRYSEWVTQSSATITSTVIKPDSMDSSSFRSTSTPNAAQRDQQSPVCLTHVIWLLAVGVHQFKCENASTTKVTRSTFKHHMILGVAFSLSPLVGIKCWVRVWPRVIFQLKRLCDIFTMTFCSCFNVLTTAI